MVSKQTVLDLLEKGLDYHQIAARTGISPGTAYLVATGMPADGSDSYPQAMRQRPGALQSRSQLLVHPAEENPTEKQRERLNERAAQAAGSSSGDAQGRADEWAA